MYVRVHMSDWEGHEVSGIASGCGRGAGGPLGQGALAPVAAVWKEYLQRYHGMFTLTRLIDAIIFPRLLFYGGGN